MSSKKTSQTKVFKRKSSTTPTGKKGWIPKLIEKTKDYINWVWEFIQRTIALLQTFWTLRHDSAYMEYSIDDYNNLYQDQDPETRQKNYEKVVINYYNLSTLFYEWGWGPSFHFAILKPEESFRESLIKHELALVAGLGLGPKSKVLDVGCGIGEPARTIARHTKAKVTGLNINPLQINRAKALTKQQGLSHLVDFTQGDFCHMSFADETFDVVYAIEATCHAPKREDVFSEIFRVLKPGGEFVAYEWCLTNRYDVKNPDHRAIIHKIEHGDGLSDSITCEQCLVALKNVGFQVVESRDVYENDKTWWSPFVGNYLKPSTFEFTPLGKWLLPKILKLFERFHLAPRGVVKISDMLMEAAEGLSAGGQMGIYTPGFYFRVRKPL